MYLYNSATHKKEELKTHTPNHVEMYTCGPTVYHFAHIGNLRSYIMEDVLEKYLRFAGYSVNHVINSGENCKVIFEIMNEGNKTAYNVVPVVAETTGMKRIYISPSVMIEQITPHNGVKYTANISAGERIKTGNVTIRIAIADEYGDEYDWQEFSLPTQR